MSDIERLVICALAVYRLAEMLVMDDGPFDMFVELRGWLQRSPDKSLRRNFYNGVSCVYCIGTWLALVFSLTFCFKNDVVDFFVFFLALSGLHSILATKLGRQ